MFVLEDKLHVRVDAPGERAVSAPIADPQAFLVDVAKKAGYEVDDTIPGDLYVSWPV